MKHYNVICTLLIVFAGSFSSCNSWLDIESDTTITQEELFKNGSGYRTALNGVYRLLGAPELYAQNLTWGYTSVLGYNYITEIMPVLYRQLEAGEYKNESVEKKTTDVWKCTYTAIANCNNIIKNIRNADTLMFEFGGVERDLILGEAIGVRAMLHFDLLRLFAPVPGSAQDDGRSCMPYVSEYPTLQPVHRSASVVYDSIVSDLKAALNYTARHDLIFNKDAMSNASDRLFGTTISGSKLPTFLGSRATRMNYYAVSGLLARVYLYGGEKEKAYSAAKDVYEKNVFSFTPPRELEGADLNVIPRKLHHDILFACINQKLYDVVDKEKNGTVGYFFQYKNTEELFGGDRDDFRFTKLISPYSNASLRWIKPDGEVGAIEIIKKQQGPVIPVVRLSEMVYIMSEYLADSDIPEAAKILSKLRLARGVKTPVSETLSREALLEVVYNDFMRESMSEGQTFFLHKRLNRPMFNGGTPVDMAGRYVIPVPPCETDYNSL